MICETIGINGENDYKADRKRVVPGNLSFSHGNMRGLQLPFRQGPQWETVLFG